MGSIQTLKPTPALITIPTNYPNQPTPGKLEILWDANYKSLYHRLSPFVDFHTSLIGGFTEQPFYYTYIDETNTGLNSLRKYESRLFPIGSAPIDVIRVSKFLASGGGIMFLAKQFLLQTGNPYNETRIYNPTSPIVAAGMGLALGSIRPMRSLDISGLGGIVRSLIGDSIPNAIFGEPKISKPPGTAPGALTGGPLDGVGGKGLLRAGDANRGRAHLEKAWPQSTKGIGLNQTFGSVLKNMATSLFANFIPATQNGIIQKSDEGAYGLMIGGGNPRFDYVGANGSSYPFGQLWIAGGSAVTVDVGFGLPPVPGNGLMRKMDEQASKPYRLFTKYINGVKNYFLASPDDLSPSDIPNVGEVGYTVHENGDKNKPGFRYGDSVGESVNDTPYANSDAMLQYKEYVDPNQAFPTKNPDAGKAVTINNLLQKVITDIKNSNGGNLYTVTVPQNATVIRSGNAATYGYDRLFNTNKKGPEINYPLGVLQDYRSVPVVDESLVTGQQRSYHLPTNGRFDSINTLTVIPKAALGAADSLSPNKDWKKLNLRGWGTKEWKPYEDDLIAFLFYDIVNENYIPFRASVKGLSEVGNTSWEELPFIGRGDKLYSYSGFNRTISFNFQIVISSIAELAPTWQRINYLTTLIKPANYTTDQSINLATNRFMVPPMVMLTIGDLYRDQPVLIQSITTTIPDDAAWETLNADNLESGVDWSYLATYIKAPGILFGQLPREIEISISLIALEKERAIVGGANFGHAPRLDNGQSPNTTAVPNGGAPNKLHKSLVVNVYKTKAAPTTPAATTPAQQPLPIPVPNPKTEDAPAEAPLVLPNHFKQPPPPTPATPEGFPIGSFT